MGLYRGGRQKGAKNKKTDLHRKCDELNVDVFTELLTIAMAETDSNRRFNKFKELAAYLYAKPKDEGDVQLTPEQIREMIREWSSHDQQAGTG